MDEYQIYYMHYLRRFSAGYLAFGLIVIAGCLAYYRKHPRPLLLLFHIAQVARMWAWLLVIASFKSVFALFLDWDGALLGAFLISILSILSLRSLLTGLPDLFYRKSEGYPGLKTNCMNFGDDIEVFLDVLTVPISRWLMCTLSTLCMYRFDMFDLCPA